MKIANRKIARTAASKTAKLVGQNKYGRSEYKAVADIIEVPFIIDARLKRAKNGSEYIEVPAGEDAPKIFGVFGGGMTEALAQDRFYGDAAVQNAQAAFSLHKVTGYGQPYDGKRRAYLSIASPARDCADLPSLGVCEGDWIDESLIKNGTFTVVS